MSLAAILGTLILAFAPRVGLSPSPVVSLPAQNTQPSQTPESSSTSPATTAAKPCPVTSGLNSSANPDCKPVASKSKRKKRKSTPPVAASADGPTKTVVRNGSTTDPTVAISPGLSEQQLSQQAHSTDLLLATADANLKAISTRQLNAAQQETVTQIKSFMEQARAASSSGDVQSAYNLANKANMLSADLKGH